MEANHKRKYVNEYNQTNYKQVNFRLTNEIYSNLSRQAIQKGYSSINAYAKALLEAASINIEIDSNDKKNMKCDN